MSGTITLNSKILVVMSDSAWARSMANALIKEGYYVTAVHDESVVGILAQRELPDLVIIERGRTQVQQLRSHPSLLRVPMIAVQQPGKVCPDEVCAEDLEQGVDLVMCGPKGYRELVARIRAVLRRERLRCLEDRTYVAGPLHLDANRFEVTVNGHMVRLTVTEFRILRELMEQPGKVLTRSDLLARLWHDDKDIYDNTIKTHIYSLRRKLEPDPRHPRFIQTVRGVGYKLAFKES